MRLSQRQGIVLPAAITLLALVANGAVFVARTYPAWRQRSGAQTAYDRSESELHAVRQQIRSLETIGRSALAADDDLRVFLDQRLIEYSRLQEVVQYIRSSAADAGVDIERVDHSMQAEASLNAIRWQTAAFGAGSYAALRQWVSALREGPGLVFVDRLEINGSGGPVLSIELTVVALLRADPAVSP